MFLPTLILPARKHPLTLGDLRHLRPGEWALWGKTGVSCLCWRQEVAVNRAQLLGELLVLPGLVTMPSVRSTAPQEACCLALVLVQPMEGRQSLSPTSKHEATIGLFIMLVHSCSEHSTGLAMRLCCSYRLHTSVKRILRSIGWGESWVRLCKEE